MLRNLLIRTLPLYSFKIEKNKVYHSPVLHLGRGEW